MHIFLAILSLFLPLFLGATCDDATPLQSSNGDDSTVSVLTVAVLQDVDNQPIKGAMVNVLGVGSDTTDTTGVVVFSDAPAGEHVATISRSGYASILATISMQPLPAKTTARNAWGHTHLVRMQRSGVTIKGKVEIRARKGDNQSAISATVELTMPVSFLDHTVTAIVDSSGQYAFFGLPERTPFECTVRRFVSEDMTYTAQSPSTLSPQPLGDTLVHHFVLETDSTDPNYMFPDTNRPHLAVTFRVVGEGNLEPIVDAKVLLVALDSVVTDSNGRATFPALYQGQYLYRVSSEGHAAVIGSLKTELEPGIGKTVITKRIEMLRTGCTILGEAVFADAWPFPSVVLPEFGTRPAIGATAKLQLPNRFLDASRTVMVDSSGRFEFRGLPENTSCSLLVLDATHKGSVYHCAETLHVRTERVTDSTIADALRMVRRFRPGLAIVKTNANPFTGGDTVSVTFSHPIDTFATSVISEIDLYMGSDKILTALDWSEDLHTLYAWPALGQLDSSLSYMLSMKKMVAISGDTGTFFLTGIGNSPTAMGDVKGIRPYKSVVSQDTIDVDWNTQTFFLTWEMLRGAYDYVVFWEESPDHWVKVRNVSVVRTTATITSPRSFEKGDSLRLIVLGENLYGGRSNPLTAVPVSVKDRRKPLIYHRYYVSSSSARIFGCDNTSDTTPDTFTKDVHLHYQVSSSSLPPITYRVEPLDTSVSPTITVKNSDFGGDAYVLPADSVSWTWTDYYRGDLRLAVPASVNAAYDTVMLDFSKITDLAGNPADTTTVSSRDYSRSSLVRIPLR